MDRKYLFCVFILIFITATFITSLVNAQPEKQQLVHFERLVQEKRYDLAWKKLEQQKLDLMNKVQENAPSFRQSFENMVELNMQNLPNSSVSDYEKNETSSDISRCI